MIAVIDIRSARTTRTGAHPSKRDSSSLAPAMVNKGYFAIQGIANEAPSPRACGARNKKAADQALTPTPIGHDTPVPPNPQ
jgi:hypothetical protein